MREDILEFLLEPEVKLGTVSGCVTTTPNLIERIDRECEDVVLVTSKSYQVKPNEGNREEIVVESSVGCFGNAVGLRNPGMEEGYRHLSELRMRRDLRVLLNVSLSANSIEDFITLARKFEGVADMLELNFSCPHAAVGYGSSIGGDVELVAAYMESIRTATDAFLIPKLTPNVPNIGVVAYTAVMAGADGIAAINTVGPETYIEPHTGKPLLFNPKGNKGGMSGVWILETALESIRDIRNAVGDKIPIIGMGGVTYGADVKRMMDAGADVVGIGTALARVAPRDRPAYFKNLVLDADEGLNHAAQFVSNKRLGEYEPHKILYIEDMTADLRVFEVEGELEYDASQFAYIWVPDVGAKPFAPAKNDPLTFVVRRREFNPQESKGLVTNALFNMKVGEDMMVRGVYGEDAPDSEKQVAYIVSGGCGIAVVPRLAEKLKDQGKEVVVYAGFHTKEEIVLEDAIREFASFIPVADEGKVGRVLDVLDSELESLMDYACFYNVGPVPLMQKAVQLELGALANKSDIFVSLETNNMCGYGICGACELGGRLVCKEGTFFSYEFLEEKGIDLNDIE